MLNSAFLYSFQSNKETENLMFKIGLGRIGCLHTYKYVGIPKIFTKEKSRI